MCGLVSVLVTGAEVGTESLIEAGIEALIDAGTEMQKLSLWEHKGPCPRCSPCSPCSPAAFGISPIIMSESFPC
jgi:hypothetical protein